MFTKNHTMRKATVARARDGEGEVHFTHILEKDVHPACQMFARLELAPGASVGAHDHTDDAEIYYILKGTFEVSDNGENKEARAGDVLYTADGESHSIRNIGTEPGELLAVILR